MTSLLSGTKLALMGACLCVSVSAATVGAGTFNLGGTAVGTTIGIDFYYSSPGDQTASVLLPTSGAFSTLTPGTLEKILNLSAPAVIPGTSFDFTNWIQLTDGINLDLTSIPIPTFPICSASSPETTGYQCLVNASSPVVLTKTDTGVAARVNLLGDAHFAGDSTDLTPFTGLLTAPTTSFSTISDFENYYTTNGYIPAVSFSASFTTTAAVAPEPEAIALSSLGLIGLSLLVKGSKFRKNARL